MKIRFKIQDDRTFSSEFPFRRCTIYHLNCSSMWLERSMCVSVRLFGNVNSKIMLCIGAVLLPMIDHKLCFMMKNILNSITQHNHNRHHIMNANLFRSTKFIRSILILFFGQWKVVGFIRLSVSILSIDWINWLIDWYCILPFTVGSLSFVVIFFYSQRVFFLNLSIPFYSANFYRIISDGTS